MNINLAEFQKIVNGTRVPVYREILADLETPVSAYLKVAAGQQISFLLESVEGGERWARYSFSGVGVQGSIKGFGRTVT